MVRLVQVTLFPFVPLINKLIEVVSVTGMVIIFVYVVDVDVKGNVNPAAASMRLIEVPESPNAVKLKMYLVFARKSTGTLEMMEPELVERVNTHTPLVITSVPPTSVFVNVGA